jgi:hypothetical protein
MIKALTANIGEMKSIVAIDCYDLFVWKKSSQFFGSGLVLCSFFIILCGNNRPRDKGKQYQDENQNK